MAHTISSGLRFRQHYSNFLQSPTPRKRKLTWNLDDGYPKEGVINTYPKRALLAGVNNGLVVSLLTSKDEIDFTCKDSTGFRVSYHTCYVTK